MSLALSTLIYEWRRYLAAIVALAFSGLLVLGTTGLFTGIVHSVLATTERTRADIFIMPPNSPQLVNSGDSGLPDRIRPLIYLNPEVTDVESLEGNGGQWVNSPGPGQPRVQTFVQIWAIDTEPGALTLPVDYPELHPACAVCARRRRHRPDRPEAAGREAWRYRLAQPSHRSAGGGPAQLPGRHSAVGRDVEGHAEADRARGFQRQDRAPDGQDPRPQAREPGRRCAERGVAQGLPRAHDSAAEQERRSLAPVRADHRRPARLLHPAFDRDRHRRHLADAARGDPLQHSRVRRRSGRSASRCGRCA